MTATIKRRCVITGLGIVSPAGCTPHEYWATLCQGRPLFEAIRLFTDEPTPQRVSRVAESKIGHGLSGRQQRRLDRFTQLAIGAARQALASAGLDLTEATGERVGILLGNCTGGWAYVEPQLYPLYHASNLDAINAYVATAWFPTAPQGELSILLGLGGFSKTIAAENISAGFALQQAIYAIQAATLDVALVGGVEAPLTPLVYNACVRGGLLSPTDRYRPFRAGADGSLLGEGAILLVVEARDHALARGATIYAEIGGVEVDATPHDAMRRCLAGSAPTVDYIVLEGRGIEAQDGAEYEAIGRLFAGTCSPWMSVPRSVYGNLLAASMAADIVTACLALQAQAIPPTATPDDDPAPLLPAVGHHVTGQALPAALKRVMVNGRDNYGQSMSILLEKAE